jgi:isopentenyl-diphosphate delta-isomerase
MTQVLYPPVIVVDEHDTEIGSAMLDDVWRQGLYHRIVSIFIVDGAGRMLLQLRGPHVRLYPNCWDQAAGGHVDVGQSYKQTAVNELAEELGVTGIPLTLLGTFRTNETLADGRIINQFERVFVATVPPNAPLQLEPSEVSKVQWFTPIELKELIVTQPDTLTPGLRHSLQKYFPDLGESNRQ